MKRSDEWDRQMKRIKEAKRDHEKRLKKIIHDHDKALADIREIAENEDHKGRKEKD